MATFSQWNRARAVRRLAWVCGPEQVLVREVLDAYRSAAPAQFSLLFAGEGPEHEVWDRLLTYPETGGRCLVVYGAEALSADGFTERLDALSDMDTAFAVFVSAEDDFARDGDGRNKVLVPHLAAIQASRTGQLIRCCAPSKTEDQVRLVASWWPGSGSNLAHDVLTRCGSLQRAYQACEQGRRAQLEPTTAMAALVCSGGVAGDFTELLMAGSRVAAMAAAQVMRPADVSPAVGLLTAQLSVLDAVREARAQGQGTAELASSLRVNRFLLTKTAPHVGAYGADRVRRCRELLASAEAALRTGVSDGVAETLAALW
jgi:hypothetical protein